MSPTTPEYVVGAAMIGLGALQAGYAGWHNDWILLVLGSIYAIIGGSFFWYEGYAINR